MGISNRPQGANWRAGRRRRRVIPLRRGREATVRRPCDAKTPGAGGPAPARPRVGPRQRRAAGGPGLEQGGKRQRRRDSDYSLYVDIVYADGTTLWGQTANFHTGTHDWEHARLVILPEKPVKRLTVYCLLRGHSGRVWFDDVAVEEIRARKRAPLFSKAWRSGPPNGAEDRQTRGPLGHARRIADEVAGRRGRFLAGRRPGIGRRSAFGFPRARRGGKFGFLCFRRREMSRTWVEAPDRFGPRPTTFVVQGRLRTARDGPGGDVGVCPADRRSRLAMGRRHPAQPAHRGQRGICKHGVGALRGDGNDVALSAGGDLSDRRAWRWRWTWPNRPSSAWATTPARAILHGL